MAFSIQRKNGEKGREEKREKCIALPSKTPPLQVDASRPLDADLAPADLRPQGPGLEGLRHGLVELRVALDGGQPEAELVGEVVAGAAAAAALDEWRGAEVLQAGAGARQGLAAALGAGGRVLRKESL